MVPVAVPKFGAALTGLSCDEISSGFPEYEFVRELGGGTFKVACLVKRGDEEVVLKVSKAIIDPERGGFPERLRREIEAMGRVDNPHVAKVLDGPDTRVVAGGERVFYLEPFYSGGTLADRLLGEPWTQDRVRELARGLLTGLEALEALGIVHRDIKPENIAFDAEDRPVLLDLGIAYFTDLTSITEPLGSSPKTARWAAPEQFEMRATVVVDSRTDLFQVGMVCFEAATGVHPFDPPDSGYIERLQEGKLNDAALGSAGIDEAAAALLRRLLQGAPNRRPRKVGIALAQLDGGTA